MFLIKSWRYEAVSWGLVVTKVEQGNNNASKNEGNTPWLIKQWLQEKQSKNEKERREGEKEKVHVSINNSKKLSTRIEPYPFDLKLSLPLSPPWDISVETSAYENPGQLF